MRIKTSDQSQEKKNLSHWWTGQLQPQPQQQHTHSHTCMHTDTYVYICVHTHAHTHTHTHTHTHAHSYTHLHTISRTAWRDVIWWIRGWLLMSMRQLMKRCYLAPLAVLHIIYRVIFPPCLFERLLMWPYWPTVSPCVFEARWLYAKWKQEWGCSTLVLARTQNKNCKNNFHGIDSVYSFCQQVQFFV